MPVNAVSFHADGEGQRFAHDIELGDDAFRCDDGIAARLDDAHRRQVVLGAHFGPHPVADLLHGQFQQAGSGRAARHGDEVEAQHGFRCECVLRAGMTFSHRADVAARRQLCGVELARGKAGDVQGNVQLAQSELLLDFPAIGLEGPHHHVRRFRADRFNDRGQEHRCRDLPHADVEFRVRL